MVFREFVSKFCPKHVLLTRQALKGMIEKSIRRVKGLGQLYKQQIFYFRLSTMAKETLDQMRQVGRLELKLILEVET